MASKLMDGSIRKNGHNPTLTESQTLFELYDMMDARERHCCEWPQGFSQCVIEISLNCVFLGSPDVT